MGYSDDAKEIVRCVGGRENIVSAAHCATRLRLIIVDNAKVDKKKLEAVPCVKGVFSSSGQLQIVIGTGTVNKVYDEFVKAAKIEVTSKEDLQDKLKKENSQKNNWLQKIIKVLGDVFVPIIPAIVAGGLIMGIMEALNFMSTNGFININSDGYVFTIFKLLSNAAFVFLPILIGFSATKVFGGNPYLGAVIAMFLVHPDLQNAWTISEGYERTYTILGIFDVHMVGYQGHVIPIIIAAFILAKIEKLLHRIVPDIIDLFVTPLVSITVTGFLIYTFIGPVFVALENGIIDGIMRLIALPYGIGSFIMGGLYSPTVVAGIHHMYTVIDVGQLAKYGVTYWLPLASAANMAQGASCLAVAMKSKKNKTKSLAFPSALSCMLGITEPAIFGVNLRYMKPFIFGCMGGAAGAMVASLIKLGATATGVTGIFAILLHLNNPLGYVISMAVAVLVAFILTWLFWVSKEDLQENIISSPLSGKIVKQQDIPDETFAKGILGTGVAIEPDEGVIVAPDNGTVSTLFDTGHAIGLELQNGVELLIHIGINTVELNGEGYTSYVKEGDKIAKGQKLIEFDIAYIKSKGYSLITPVLITNQGKYSEIDVLQDDKVNKNHKLMHFI